MHKVAKNGKEGVDIAKAEQPDIIILDLVMPAMDGYTTYRALRADKDTKHIEIIAYTAQPPEIVAKKEREAMDIVDFIMKPFDAKTLVLSVKEILKEIN